MPSDYCLDLDRGFRALAQLQGSSVGGGERGGGGERLHTFFGRRREIIIANPARADAIFNIYRGPMLTGVMAAKRDTRRAKGRHIHLDAQNTSPLNEQEKTGPGSFSDARRGTRRCARIGSARLRESLERRTHGSVDVRPTIPLNVSYCCGGKNELGSSTGAQTDWP